MLPHMRAEKVAICERAQRRIERQDDYDEANCKEGEPTLPAKDKEVKKGYDNTSAENNWIEGPGREKEL